MDWNGISLSFLFSYSPYYEICDENCNRIYSPHYSWNHLSAARSVLTCLGIALLVLRWDLVCICYVGLK